MEIHKPKNIDDYILLQDVHIQLLLEQLRKTIKQCVPEAVECISYAMPVFKLNGRPLVYFGAAKKHIGLYATPNVHDAFRDRLSTYKQGKGSVQFPLNNIIPFDLIEEMVIFKAEEIRKSQNKE